MGPSEGKAAGLFLRSFGEEPQSLGIAPGRVELLGNHTDYNGGYILCAALDRTIAVAAAPGAEGRIRLVSETRPKPADALMDGWRMQTDTVWGRYPVGVMKGLVEAGSSLQGARMALAGNVPVGAGLSSSAALEVASAQALLALDPLPLDGMALARLCQRAENEFVGVGCGLMDQFAAVFGAADTALFLDCLTQDWMEAAFPQGAVSIVIVNSMEKHALVQGAYNQRRRECMDAAASLGQALARPVQRLRDVTPEEFEAVAHALDDSLRKRARHVISENQRVLDGLEALRRGKLEVFGQMMFESHASSRRDFENSTPRLDRIVEIARATTGVIGAKLSGGGFGGCVVCLVHRPEAGAFGDAVSMRFEQEFSVRPDIHFCAIGDGARGRRLDG